MPPFPPNTPLYHVSGRVIDDVTGRPISGATVNLSSLCKISSNSSSNNEQYFSQRALTGLDGSFDFDRIPPIAVNLEASKDNYLQVFTFRRTADDPLGWYVIGPNSDSVTLTIGPAASISGSVRGADGTPIGDAWVTLERLTAWAGWRRLESYNTIQTDASGNYRFGLLPPGRYFLVAQPWLGPARPPGHDGAGKPVGYVPVRYPPFAAQGDDTFLEIAEGQQASVGFRFHKEPLHRVTVTFPWANAGAPIIDVIDRSGSSSYPSTTSFGDPSQPCCTLDAWLPAGNFRLSSQFSAPGGSFAGSMRFQVANTDISGLKFDLKHTQSVAIPIEITAPGVDSTGLPCSNDDATCEFWFLQLISLQPNGYFEAGPQSSMTGWTQPSGGLRTENIVVSPGTYFLAVATTGNIYASTINNRTTNLIHDPLTIIPGDAPDPIHVVLSQGGTVEGTTRRGHRPGRAWVYAISQQPDARIFQPTLSDSDGKFRLQGLAPLPYLVFAADVALDLDIHDPTVLNHWRPYAQSVTPEPGKTIHLDLRSSPVSN